MFIFDVDRFHGNTDGGIIRAVTGADHNAGVTKHITGGFVVNVGFTETSINGIMEHPGPFEHTDRFRFRVSQEEEIGEGVIDDILTDMKATFFAGEFFGQ